MGSEGPQWGPVELMCSCVSLSLHISIVSLYLHLYVRSPASLFGNQRARPVIARSTFSRYIYIWIYIYTLILDIVSFISSVGVQLHGAFIPTLGYGGPQWAIVELICLSIFPSVCMLVCVSVGLSLCLSVHSSVPVFGDKSVRPVIVCSKCGCYIYSGGGGFL